MICFERGFSAKNTKSRLSVESRDLQLLNLSFVERTGIEPVIPP